MMSKVAVIFALLAFSAIATAPVASVPTAQTGENDITQCLNDINQLVTLIPQFINDLQSGDFGKILGDLTKLVTLIQQTVTDCTQSKEVLKANGISQQCITDITEALPLIQETINDISSGDFSKIISDVLKLVSQFHLIAQDCTASTFPEFKRNDITQCLNDITAIVKLVPQIINEIEAGQITKIISDLTTLITLVQKTVTDCASHQEHLHKHNISPKCFTDISDALPIIQKTIEDVTKGDIAAVLRDAVQLVSEFKQIMTDCASSTTFPHVYIESVLSQQ